MKPPFEKADSVETQLFGARPQDETVIVDIEEPSPKKENEQNKTEAIIEPVIINVVENGDKKSEGRQLNSYPRSHFYNQRFAAFFLPKVVKKRSNNADKHLKLIKESRRYV